MTDHDERDAKLTEAYRGLAQPEPPARLDDAILAASRRAVHAGPRVSSVRRWTVPLSLAAAVVLSVLVTLRVQDEAPEIVAPTAQAPSIPAQVPSTTARAPSSPPTVAKTESPEKLASAPAPRPEPEPAARKADANVAADALRNQAPKAEAALPEAMREAPRYEAKLPKFAQDPAPAAAERRDDAVAAQAPPPAPAAVPAAPARAPAQLGRIASQEAASAGAPAGEVRPHAQVRERAASGASVDLAKREGEAETPERQLERIATLRREGRHAEADKLLAEFKQRYPQYRIPEPMLEKVQPPR